MGYIWGLGQVVPQSQLCHCWLPDGCCGADRLMTPLSSRNNLTSVDYTGMSLDNWELMLLDIVFQKVMCLLWVTVRKKCQKWGWWRDGDEEEEMLSSDLGRPCSWTCSTGVGVGHGGMEDDSVFCLELWMVGYSTYHGGNTGWDECFWGEYLMRVPFWSC